MTCRMAFLGLVLSVLSGCTSMRAQCPAEGGRPWVEVRSPHFSVRTNLDTETAEEAARELELLRQGLLQAWASSFDPPGSVEVIVLHNRSALQEFTNIRIEGFSATTADGPVLVLAGNAYAFSESPADMGTQAHELTHYLSEFALVRQPRWLSEGLAAYLESIYLRPEKHEVILGGLHLPFLNHVQRSGWRTLNELWEWDGKELLSTAESRQYYASAWLWVHFFISRHGARFEDFQTRLMRGEEPRVAWEQAFRGVKDLAGELHGYVYGGRHVTYPTVTAPLKSVKSPLVTRPLAPAEVHAIRAQLFLMTPGASPPEERLENAQREMAQALKEEPGNVSAILLRIRSTADPARRLELARHWWSATRTAARPGTRWPRRWTRRATPPRSRRPPGFARWSCCPTASARRTAWPASTRAPRSRRRDRRPPGARWPWLRATRRCWTPGRRFSSSSAAARRPSPRRSSRRTCSTRARPSGCGGRCTTPWPATR
ncbi:hypothetical protein ACLESD_38370, partial [Pyxidicoccus sp. 3LFB2]